MAFMAASNSRRMVRRPWLRRARRAAGPPTGPSSFRSPEEPSGVGSSRARDEPPRRDAFGLRVPRSLPCRPGGPSASLGGHRHSSGSRLRPSGGPFAWALRSTWLPLTLLETHDRVGDRPRCRSGHRACRSTPAGQNLLHGFHGLVGGAGEGDGSVLEHHRRVREADGPGPPVAPRSTGPFPPG